MVTPINQI